MIKLMCKHDQLDVDFSEKQLECLTNIIDDDEDFIQDTTLTKDEQIKALEKMFDKFCALLDGDEVTFDSWSCKLVEV